MVTIDGAINKNDLTEMVDSPPQNQSVFFPSRWYRGLQENEISREAERVRVSQAIDTALNELRTKYEWGKTYLFGSIAKRGQFRAGSDVDIALEGLDKFKLYAFMGDISLLLSRNVDVVRLEECPFASKIRETGIPWTSQIE